MSDFPDITDDGEYVIAPDSELGHVLQALTITDPGSGDTARLLSDMNLRLERIELTVDALKEGVNTIGEMMNQVATVFDDLAGKVKSGGISALLGGFMGGNKNG